MNIQLYINQLNRQMLIQNGQGQLIQSQILYYQQPIIKGYIRGVQSHKMIIRNENNNSWVSNKIQQLDEKISEISLKRSRCDQELNNEQLIEKNRQLMKAIQETQEQINAIKQEQFIQREYQQRVNTLLDEKQQLQDQLSNSCCSCYSKIQGLEQQLRDTESIIEDISKKCRESEQKYAAQQKSIVKLKSIIDQQSEKLIEKENENQQLRLQLLKYKHIAHSP